MKKDMNEDKKKHQEMKKTDADLLIPVQDYDPTGKRVYSPAILKKALIGALTAGFLIALLFWLVASGNLPVTGLGQISSADYGAAAFFGFVTGSAVGGLAGSISGIRDMLHS